MTLTELQPEPVELLGAACSRATSLIGPDLAALVSARITATLGGVPSTLDGDGLDDRDRDCLALVDQMLIDVASVSDATVASAARHFDSGGLSDFVTATYVTEARIRLGIAADLLLGGMA